MHVDDVAVDFPTLKIVLAHPSFPWQDEAISIAVHKPQVYIDLSGWSPKYFPPQLVHHANTLLRERVLFGTDYPFITPDRWLADFDTLDIKPEVRPLDPQAERHPPARTGRGSMSDRRPVVVYGASGFSARLIIEFLREYNVPFVAAGRNREKIEEVLAHVPGIGTADYEIVQVDARRSTRSRRCSRAPRSSATPSARASTTARRSPRPPSRRAATTSTPAARRRGCGSRTRSGARSSPRPDCCSRRRRRTCRRSPRRARGSRSSGRPGSTRSRSSRCSTASRPTDRRRRSSASSSGSRSTSSRTSTSCGRR